MIWALAVPSNMPVTVPNDLRGVAIHTPLASVTQQFVEKNRLAARVEYVPANKPLPANQPVVQLIESGTSLLSQGYRILCPVLYSRTCLVANRQSYSYTWKRVRLEELRDTLIESAFKLPVNGKKLFAFTDDAFPSLIPVDPFPSAGGPIHHG